MPDEDGTAPDWDAGLTIETMPISFAICVPRDGDTVAAGQVEVRGYAVAYGRRVARIDISTHKGDLDPSAQHYHYIIPIRFSDRLEL